MFMTGYVALVEDQEDVRDALVGLLETRGLEVVAAEHGAELLEAIRSRGERPLVLILDLWMPVMDGRALLAAQPTEPLLAGVPVVLVTVEDVRLDLMPATVKAFVQKPFLLDDLVDAIAPWVELDGGANRARAGARRLARRPRRPPRRRGAGRPDRRGRRPLRSRRRAS
jgi:CheY-like chemotaxis protein